VRRSVVIRVAGCNGERTVKEFKGKEAPVIAIALIASVLEVGLVVFAAAVFLTMIVAALAVIVWSIAGVFSATHQDPATHH
jgi:fatty acid desaturase